MYEETLKRKPARGFDPFLSILIVVFTILLLMLLVGYAQIIWNIGYLQYILLTAVLTFLVLMLLRQFTRYRYVLTDSRVLACRGISKKQKAVFEFEVKDIEQFGRIFELRPLSGKKKYRLLFEYMEKDAFFIVIPGAVVALAPTETFIQKLKEVYEKTHC